jgi:hypothetical protein
MPKLARGEKRNIRKEIERLGEALVTAALSLDGFFG